MAADSAQEFTVILCEELRIQAWNFFLPKKLNCTCETVNESEPVCLVQSLMSGLTTVRRSRCHEIG